jgi:MSHA biogenesis protein MshO
MRALQAGFNLVEVIIVITVVGILVVAIGPVVTRPFVAYDDLSTRTALVDSAQSALSQITNDVRDTIPNTLRTNGTTAIEFMPIQLGGRYRYDATPSAVTGLTPSASDASFQVLGNIASIPSGSRIVVYNTGATQFYNAAISGTDGIISPASTTVTLSDNGNEDQLTLSSGFQFDNSGNGSPARRFYVATTPVSYVCDTSAGTLVRYSGYAINASQPTNPAVSPLSGASSTLITDLVSACDFDYTPGSNSRAGLLVIDLTLTLDGEVIQLLQQVHVSNAP